MNYDFLNDLLISYEKSDIDNLCDYSYYVFIFFYDIFNTKPYMEIPDTPLMFMEIDNWYGMSMRCGVWQYYEYASCECGKLQKIAGYLKSQGENDMAEVFAYGIHDYYSIENGEYPQKWLDESEKIDKWIYKNENYILQWQRKLILDHKDEIMQLAEKTP